LPIQRSPRAPPAAPAANILVDEQNLTDTEPEEHLPKDAREEMEVTKVYDPYFGTTTSATHIAALELDPETCKVRLELVAEDCGRIINPMIVDGQVHGAVVQGVGRLSHRRQFTTMPVSR
jgi:CO/xanthine dehydrogenase Mo-binding subunit